MPDLMQTLFRYISEKRVTDLLPRHFGALLEVRAEALTQTFTPEQAALWDQLEHTRIEYDLLYEQALFQAAFALARELC